MVSIYLSDNFLVWQLSYRILTNFGDPVFRLLSIVPRCYMNICKMFHEYL